LVQFGLISFGFTEMLVIAVLVIVFVGPDRLPEMMRFVGKQYGRLRRASDELRRAFQLEVDRADSEERSKEIRRRREALMARRRAEKEKNQSLPVARPDDLAEDDTPEDEDPGGLAAQALADAGVPSGDTEPFETSDDPTTEEAPARDSASDAT
jgi:Tat protein translocase TatB subunit